MKREIKFRAWDRMDKTMYNIREIDFLANAEINSIRLVVAVQTSDEDIDFGFPVRRNGEYDLMQYTGLKDKNGKEIYEGDVVRTETEKAMMVSWNVHFASFCLDRDGWMFTHYFGEAVNPDQIEVIGNIYENPELIESKS